MESNSDLVLRAQCIARTLTYNEDPEGSAKRVISELCHRLDAAANNQLETACRMLLESSPAHMTHRNRKERQAYKLIRTAIASQAQEGEGNG